MNNELLSWAIGTFGSFFGLLFPSIPSINYVEKIYHREYVPSQVIVRYKDVAERIVIETQEYKGQAAVNTLEADAAEEVARNFEAVDEAIGILEQKELQDVELQPKSIKLKQAPDIPPVEKFYQDPLSHVYVVTFQKGTVEEAISAFLRSSLVTGAQPNFIYRSFAQPNDPYFADGSLWGMKNIQADSAWDISRGSSDRIVAVVDTGVDWRHSDLSANMWRGVVNGTETYGWDFAANDSDPADENGHGTHLAGIIGAVGNNAVGVTGVNWNVKLMAVRVLDADGGGTSATISQGIRFAADHGADIVNLSLGGRDMACNTDVGLSEDAITDGVLSYAVRTKGVLVTAAAGNEHDNAACFYPANHPDVLVVSATNNTDGFSRYSNYGVRSWKTSKIVAAPGGASTGNVNDCTPNQCILSTWKDNGYVSVMGTSMAAPHAAGVAALVLSRRDMNPFSLRQWLIDTADDIGGDFKGPISPFLTGDDGQRSYGKRVNAYQALARLSAGPTATPTATPTSGAPSPTSTVAPSATNAPVSPSLSPTVIPQATPTPAKAPDLIGLPPAPPLLRYPPPFVPIPPLLLEMPRDPVAVWMSAIEGEREVILTNGQNIQRGTYVSVCYNRLAGPYQIILDRGDGATLAYNGIADKPMTFGCLYYNNQRFFPIGGAASMGGVAHRVTITSGGQTASFAVRVTI